MVSKCQVFSSDRLKIALKLMVDFPTCFYPGAKNVLDVKCVTLVKMEIWKAHKITHIWYKCRKKLNFMACETMHFPTIFHL